MHNQKQRKWLHGDIFSMAAAYAYHICQNHPFVDGNKRVALVSALVFLEINGITLLDPEQKLLDGMLKMANGKMGEEDFSVLLRKLPRE